MSGPHAPSAVAAQQKLHRSSPAVRAAVARVAQDGRGHHLVQDAVLLPSLPFSIAVGARPIQSREVWCRR